MCDCPGLRGLHLQLHVVGVPVPELQHQVVRRGGEKAVSGRDDPGLTDDGRPALV